MWKLGFHKFYCGPFPFFTHNIPKFPSHPRAPKVLLEGAERGCVWLKPKGNSWCWNLNAPPVFPAGNFAGIHPCPGLRGCARELEKPNLFFLPLILWNVCGRAVRSRSLFPVAPKDKGREGMSLIPAGKLRAGTGARRDPGLGYSGQDKELLERVQRGHGEDLGSGALTDP